MASNKGGRSRGASTSSRRTPQRTGRVTNPNSRDFTPF